MKEFYIGDFYNPEEEKESWEDYIKRKQKEEEAATSLNTKGILFAIFIAAAYGCYYYLNLNPETGVAKV